MGRLELSGDRSEIGGGAVGLRPVLFLGLRRMAWLIARACSLTLVRVEEWPMNCICRLYIASGIVEPDTTIRSNPRAQHTRASLPI